MSTDVYDRAYEEILAACRAHVAAGGKLQTGDFGLLYVDGDLVPDEKRGCCALGAWAYTHRVERVVTPYEHLRAEGPSRQAAEVVIRASVRVLPEGWLVFALGFDRPLNLVADESPWYALGRRVRRACEEEGLLA